MGFNEKVHAYLAAQYYQALKEQFGERGRAAFIHAVQYYGFQRGRRMAQRAIWDGKPLTHPTFMEYNELLDSKDQDVVPADGELESLSPDYVLHITNCPWHDQFQVMGCLEAGGVYCSYIDEAVSRGFEPEIIFQADKNLNTDAYCDHRVVGVHYQAFPDAPQKKEYAHAFDYHCGHLYWSFRETVTAIFGVEGDALGARVLQQFTQDYGDEMAERLLSYRDTNFNVC